MTKGLVSYAQAKAHLRLADDREQTDVEEKIQQATDFVLKYINRVENDWTAETDPGVDVDFGIVQGAILRLLADYFGNRNDTPDQVREDFTAGAYLRPDLRRQLHLLRRPSLA